jgi:hypothetical protein
MSHAYMRLLRGEINSQQYVRIVKRAVEMRLRLEHKRRVDGERRAE